MTSNLFAIASYPCETPGKMSLCTIHNPHSKLVQSDTDDTIFFSTSSFIKLSYLIQSTLTNAMSFIFLHTINKTHKTSHQCITAQFFAHAQTLTNSSVEIGSRRTRKVGHIRSWIK